MRYLSVCSGIEAATVAWHPLGWQPVAFADVDQFASALLAHYYPDVPNLGDMEAHGDWQLTDVDLLVGGTPCQSFSVAGLRGGMADPRGNLALVYLAIADQFRPEWLVWENVPGVLSSNGGRDFGAFLGGLVELGYGFAYRVLDAQHFGVPQRRRRVFVVGCLGGWQRAAAVLFERASLRGDSAPSREAGASVARCVTRGSDSGQRYDGETETFVTGTLRANSGRNQIEGPYVARTAGNNPRPRNLVACFDETQITHPENRSLARADTASLAAAARPPAVAFDMRGRDGGSQFEGPHDTANIRAANGGSSRSYVAEAAVRRLTPRECERLQGFPDDYTLIAYRGKPASDSARYRALGNSMAVPVMRWIGERIQQVNETRP